MTNENLSPEDQAEVNYGEHLIWRLVGSKITMFGANEDGNILLSVEKDGVKTDLMVGRDEAGEITLFEFQAAKDEAVTND